MADASPRTDISTDDTDEKNQRVNLFCSSHTLKVLLKEFSFSYSECKSFSYSDCKSNLVLSSSPELMFLYLYVQFDRGKGMAVAASDSSDRTKDKTDQKVIYIRNNSF